MNALTRDAIIAQFMKKEEMDEQLNTKNKIELELVDSAFNRNDVEAVQFIGDVTIRRSNDALKDFNVTMQAIENDPVALAQWNETFYGSDAWMHNLKALRHLENLKRLRPALDKFAEGMKKINEEYYKNCRR